MESYCFCAHESTECIKKRKKDHSIIAQTKQNKTKQNKTNSTEKYTMIINIPIAPVANSSN